MIFFKRITSLNKEEETVTIMVDKIKDNINKDQDTQTIVEWVVQVVKEVCNNHVITE